MTKVVILSLLILTLCGVKQSSRKVIYLQNDFIKIGLLPDVGGRLVYVSTVDGENILLSDSMSWNEPSEKRIIPTPKSRFKPYNGLITWLGPQSEWWSHQDLVPEKKGDVWPPDPFLIYSIFEVSGQTDTSIVLTGPESPITGVKMIKYFTLSGNKVHIKVTAQNIRTNDVAWDIWSNARFDAYSDFKIPIDSSGILKIELQNERFSEAINYELKDGYFSFIPELPVDPKKQKISKAFLYPIEGKIIVDQDKSQLVIEFEKVPFEKIHPEQALVEVYNLISTNGRSNILELEHHSAYTTLKPSEKMELSETWTIIPR